MPKRKTKRSVRTNYSSWGGGETAGDYVKPGNNGGGYPNYTKSFLKFYEGAGDVLHDSATGESATKSGAAFEWTDGGLYVDNLASVAVTVADWQAGHDYVFICVCDQKAGQELRNLFGALGLNKGMQFSKDEVTFKPDGGSVTVSYGASIPDVTDVGIYCYVDDSASEVYAGWFTADDEAHSSAVTANAVCTTTNQIGITNSTLYSMCFLEYAVAPSLATVKTATQWMLEQHTSAECKSDPTKRIIYPEL